MGVLDIYFNKLADAISGGDLFNRGKIAPTDVKPVYSRIITKNKLKRVIMIDLIPIDYSDNLSEILNNIVKTVSRTCGVFVLYSNYPTKLEIKNQKFKRQMKAAKERYEGMKAQYESLDPTSKSLGFKKRLKGGKYFTLNKAKLDEAKSWSDSYDYILEVIRAGGTMYDSVITIEVTADNNKQLDRCFDLIGDYLASKDIMARDVKGFNAKYLRQMSPTGYINYSSDTELDNYSTLYLSDENISHILPHKYTGIVSDGTGILLGVDSEKYTPFTVNYFESGQAQVNLITAMSGYGKTYTAYQIALSFLIQDHHVSVLDIKGNEWNLLSKFIKPAIVSIGGTNPMFVNLLRLDDLQVTEEDCEQFYRLAVSGMKQLVSLLCALDEKLDKKEVLVVTRFIEEAVGKLYLINKVYPDSPASFRNSKDIKYSDLIPILTGLRDSVSLSERNKVILDDVLFSCSEFFRGRGEFQGMFDNEVTLQQIIDQRFVIYSMDKNEDSSSSYIDSIKVFFVQFLDKKKQMIRRRQGKFTAVFFEELQRKEEFKTLVKFISGTVTGARSSNVVVFLLCNTLGIFKEPDADMQAIASNITSYIIGKVGKDDIKVLKENFRCAPILKDIEAISENQKQNRNVFAAFYDTGKSMGYSTIKAELPQSISKELQTRTILS